MKSILDRLASGRVLAVLAPLTLAALLVVNLVDFRISVPHFRALSGGYGPLDLELYASAEQAYRILAAYGVEGRRLHLWLLASIDVVLPVLMALFLVSGLGFVLPRTFGARRGMVHLRLLGVLALLVDYAENAAIALLLLHYPERLDALAVSAGMLTMLKLALYWGSLLFLVVNLVVLCFVKQEAR